MNLMDFKGKAYFVFFRPGIDVDQLGMYFVFVR